MAILIDETKRVLVQGITGREGKARTRLILEKPMRRIDPVKHGYDGPAPQKVKE